MHVWEIHAAVVHFPIAFLIGGVLLDLFGRRGEAVVRASTYLILAGVATAAVAAAAGLVAFYTVPGNHTPQAHERIIYHLWSNVTALVLFGVVGLARWRSPAVVSPAIRGLGLVAALVLVVAAYLGGDVVYHGGMGIEPTILKPGLRATPDAG